MFVDTPVNTLRIAAMGDDRSPSREHFLFDMRADYSRFLMENRGAVPTPENYAAAAGHI